MGRYLSSRSFFRSELGVFLKSIHTRSSTGSSCMRVLPTKESSTGASCMPDLPTKVSFAGLSSLFSAVSSGVNEVSSSYQLRY